MQKKVKIGIAIVIILLIILAISIWDEQKITNSKVKINCKTECFQVGNGNWTFPGVGPISQNIFPTEKDCISACQNRIKR